MAKYPDLITTKKGLDLNSAANAAQKAVIFTKVTVGDGDVPSDTSVMDLTAVVSPKMNLDITNKENKGNGQFTIRATLGNDTLEQGFYAKEIGVYAKLDGDKEVLYAYTNGGNYVDYIPDKSSPIDAQVFNIEVIIGNLQQATIVIEDETHITEKDLQDHNTSDSAHENRFGLFEKIADLGNDIIKKLVWADAKMGTHGLRYAVQPGANRVYLLRQFLWWANYTVGKYSDRKQLSTKYAISNRLYILV